MVLKAKSTASDASELGIWTSLDGPLYHDCNITDSLYQTDSSESYLLGLHCNHSSSNNKLCLDGDFLWPSKTRLGTFGYFTP